MQISKNKVVSVLYELREKDINGEVLEKVDPAQPFVFLFGIGSLLPAFEANLDGLAVGGKFSFGIVAAEAYGVSNPNAIVDLPIETFIIDGELATDILQAGNFIPMRNDQGQMIRGKVVKVDEKAVKMDFNPPMADKDLFFSGEVLDIREATAEEIEHGHVHGPGGHNH